MLIFFQLFLDAQVMDPRFENFIFVGKGCEIVLVDLGFSLPINATVSPANCRGALYFLPDDVLKSFAAGTGRVASTTWDYVMLAKAVFARCDLFSEHEAAFLELKARFTFSATLEFWRSAKAKQRALRDLLQKAEDATKSPEHLEDFKSFLTVLSFCRWRSNGASSPGSSSQM